MTRTTNARIAGLTYLLYIATAFPAMVMFDRATSADGIAAKIAGIAENATDVRITVVLSVLNGFMALILAVTLYAITRDEDRDIALLGFAGRVGEGVNGAFFTLDTLGLLWLGTAADTPDAAVTNALGAFFLKARVWNVFVGAISFAFGSTMFCWLLLRGRMIPAPLSWLGFLSSVLLVVVLPLQLIGLFDRPVFALVWLPMGVFEIVVGVWFLIKGVGGGRSAGPATA